MKLLVVDDEKAMADAIADNLEFEGFQVTRAYGGQPALDALLAEKHALVVLDVMMPDLDGFEVLEKLRRNNDQTPVIFLTARSAEADKLRGLGLGADDYVVKPFSILELVARVKAVLNRTSPGSGIQNLKLGDVLIDFGKMTLEKKGVQEELGRYEADLLRLLASEPGRIFSRDEILDSVWGMETYPTNRTIDNQVVKLRRKIEDNPKQPRRLISIYGKGYKLQADRTTPSS